MNLKCKKKSYSIFLWIVLPLLLYLCYVQIARREVSDTHFVEIFCIDYTDNHYHITGFYDNAASKDNNGFQMIDGYGASVYSAYTDMSRKNSKDISLDHTAYFMLSETAASYGLEHCLDFISREPDMKTNAKVYILKTRDANGLLEKAMEEKFSLSETLDSITNKQSNNLKKPMNTLLQVYNNMEHKDNSLLLPYLVYEDKTMYLEGYATFKNGKLYRYLNYELSLFIDLFRNNIRTCPLELKPEMCVELFNIESTPQVNVTKDTLNIEIKVKADSTVKEAANTAYVFEQQNRNQLSELERKKLTENLMEIITLMKQEKLDLLNIGFELDKKADTLPVNRTWDSYLNHLRVTFTLDMDTAKTYILETD